MSELWQLTLAEAAEGIQARKISPVELVRAELARIEARNPVLNAYVTVLGGQALRDAQIAEDEIATGGYRGPCGFADDGLPVGLQLVTRPFAEPRLFQIAESLERQIGQFGRPASD